jgi:uncharacterized protein (DUF3820 family)
MPVLFNLKPSPPRQHLDSIRDVMEFGKHNGVSVADVCHDEPSYLMWLYEKEIITIDDGLLQIIMEAVDSHRREPSDYYEDWEGEIPY